jgi:transcriptional regulator
MLMYTPKKFVQSDPAQLLAFMRENNFAMLVTAHPQRGISASHLPFLIEQDTGSHKLFTHMAEANPQWRELEGRAQVMVVFTGPHAYITPRWYTKDGYVPTWNYTAVHAYGAAQLVADPDRCTALIERTVRAHEHGAGAWSIARLEAERFASLQRRIVHVEIDVDRIEGKFKLSQDKPEPEREALITGLQAEGSPAALAVAELMRRHRARD